MADVWILTQFFRQQGARAKEEFLSQFDGAFLLARQRKESPLLAYLHRKKGFKLVIGGEEECDLEFDGDPTLDPRHCEVAYHPGFRGWTVSDLGTSYGTHVDGKRVTKERATLLSDRSVIRPGGGLTELQYYEAETLYERMVKAGITHSLRRRSRRLEEPAEVEEAPEGVEEEAASLEDEAASLEDGDEQGM